MYSRTIPARKELQLLQVHHDRPDTEGARLTDDSAFIAQCQTLLDVVIADEVPWIFRLADIDFCEHFSPPRSQALLIPITRPIPCPVSIARKDSNQISELPKQVTQYPFKI